MASSDGRNDVNLFRQITRYSWQHAILLLSVFVVSWYEIYQYQSYQLKQNTIQASRRLLNQISVQSIKNKQDIDALYLKIKKQSSDRMFLLHMNDYVEYFKHHLEAESIFFSTTQASSSVVLLNPYLSTSSISASKEHCDAALGRQAIQLDSNQSVAIVSDSSQICIYHATHQVITVMNMNAIHHILQAEMHQGYFIVQLLNQNMTFKENEPSFSHDQPFDYFGMPLTYRIYPNQAYVDAQHDLSFLIALLITGLFLMVLLIADRVYRLKYEKMSQTKIFELGYLRKLIYYDHLTGLANRKYLLLRLRSALSRAKQYRSYFSLCFIDCDNFKQVNDHYGHHVGDLLLKHIGQVVTQKIRDKDFFARLSGDEFCLILDGCVSDAAIDVALRKILIAIAEPVVIETYTLSITVSIGVLVCRGSSQLSLEQLLDKADRAMYQAKHKQKGAYAIAFEDDGHDDNLNGLKSCF